MRRRGAEIYGGSWCSAGLCGVQPLRATPELSYMGGICRITSNVRQLADQKLDHPPISSSASSGLTDCFEGMNGLILGEASPPPLLACLDVPSNRTQVAPCILGGNNGVPVKPSSSFQTPPTSAWTRDHTLVPGRASPAPPFAVSRHLSMLQRSSPNSTHNYS